MSIILANVSRAQIPHNDRFNETHWEDLTIDFNMNFAEFTKGMACFSLAYSGMMVNDPTSVMLWSVLVSFERTLDVTLLNIANTDTQLIASSVFESLFLSPLTLSMKQWRCCDVPQVSIHQQWPRVAKFGHPTWSCRLQHSFPCATPGCAPGNLEWVYPGIVKYGSHVML